MKIRFLYLCLIILFLPHCKSKKNSETAKVTIEFTISRDYCGGAAPSEEMLKELTSVKPFISSKFYLVQRNDEGILLSETEHNTDNQGKLTLKIKKGMYEIYMYSAEQRKNLTANIDEKYRACSAIYYEQPQGQLHAWQKGIQKVNIHVKCNPCIPPAP